MVVVVTIYVRIRDEQRHLLLSALCNDQSRTCIALRDHVTLHLDQANCVWVGLKMGGRRRGLRVLDGLLLVTGQDRCAHCEDMPVGVAYETVSGVAQGMTVEAVDASVACIYPRELVALEGAQRTWLQVLRADVEDAHTLVSRYLTRVLEREVPYRITIPVLRKGRLRHRCWSIRASQIPNLKEDII